jgi:hypothetical protein
VKVALALASDVTDAAPATGIHTESARNSARNRLIAIPLKFANAKEDTYC